MKIHEELLALSRKADKIISSINLNLDIFRNFKAKAIAIMTCKTHEELKKLSKSKGSEKKYKKFEIPLEESKIHLHSNKSSTSNISGFSDQNNVENSSEREKGHLNYKQSSNSSSMSNGKEFSAENSNSNADALKNGTNKRYEFASKNFDSNTTQQNVSWKNSKESHSKNFVRVNNFHSASFKISSKSSTSKDTDGIYSSTNFVFEKRQDIDVMEKTEENNGGTISQKFVIVSTIIKTSYSKSSNENSEEVVQNETYGYNENSNFLRNGNYKELRHGLPVNKQMEVGKSYYRGNIKSNEILPEKSIHLPDQDPKCNTDFIVSNKNVPLKIYSYNVMPQNFQFDKPNDANQLDIYNLNSANQILTDSHSNIPYSTIQTTEALQDVHNMKIKISENCSVLESNISDNPKSVTVFETKVKSIINSIRIKDNSEISGKKKKKNIITKNLQGVSAIPVLIENKEPFSLNSKKICEDHRINIKLNLNRSPLPTNRRGYNLRSTKNNPSLKTNRKYSKKCSMHEFNKNLSLKEKIAEKKRLREQKMKRTRERREHLEKARKERLRLSEERRMNRFEQHKKILKRKIMDVKNKAKCRKQSKQFANSSETSPENNSEPQPLSASLNQTYLIESFKDISPIEPTENKQERSSGEGLNCSLLYSPAYDKKIFLKQSVVLTDIAQLMPPGTIQNCLSSNQKKTVPICNLTSNYTNSYKVNKMEISVIGKKDSPNAPIKKQMRSTRKISVSPNNTKRNESRKRRPSNSPLNDRKQEKSRKLLNGTEYVKSLFPQDSKNFHDGIENSVTLKLNSQYKGKDTSHHQLRNDPKLSLKPYVVLEKLPKSKSERAVHLEMEISNQPMKVKAATLPSNIISSDPKLSVLSPVVVLKDITNIKSNDSRLTPDKLKAEKTIALDSDTQRDPKLTILKPEAALKDLTNIKSGQIMSKKSGKKSKKVPKNYKRKAQGHLNNSKPTKKPLIINKSSENKNKSSSSSKQNQSSDISSYEISDISDNSINVVEEKPKKIPSWATNIHLKQAILKQHYEPPEADAIFGNFKNQKAINLAEIFTTDKPHYHNRTSSAKWSADESPI